MKKKHSLARVWQVFAPFRRHFLAVFTLMLLGQLLALSGPYIFGRVINGLIAGLAWESLISLSLVALGIGLIQSSMTWWRERYELKHIDFKISAYVTTKTLDHLFGLSIGQHRNQHSGLTQSIVNTGEGAIVQLIQNTLYQALPIALQVVVTISALFWLDWRFGCLVSVGVVLFGFLTYRANKRFLKPLKDLKDKSHSNNKSHNELVRNLPLIQVNSQQERVGREHRGRLESFGDLGRDLWNGFIGWWLGREYLVSIIRFSVLSLGIYLVSTQGYPAGSLVVITMWTGLALGNLNQAGQIHRQLLDQWTSVQKYFGILDIVPAVTVSTHPITLKPVKGRIEFENVVFGYPRGNYFKEGEEEKPHEGNGDGKKAPEEEKRNSLNGVSFVIEAGQRVAFVGSSGAGKSTIISLIMRAYDPDNGSVTVDGHNLRDLDLVAYRRAIGFVEQNVALFDESLAYNMLFGIDSPPEGSERERILEEAAAASRINHFYPRLTDRFETKIGENGIQLSGGERQRVGIARALIKKPAILILDEATSNLDAVNEDLIRQSVEAASVGRTTILVAHRLSTVVNADKIFVLDHGSIVGEGKHQELLETCSIYGDLVRTQLLN